jgi:hypothetical protein
MNIPRTFRLAQLHLHRFPKPRHGRGEILAPYPFAQRHPARVGPQVWIHDYAGLEFAKVAGGVDVDFGFVVE